MVIIDNLEFPNATLTDKASFEFESRIHSVGVENLKQRSDFFDFWNQFKNRKICFMVQKDNHIFMNEHSLWTYDPTTDKTSNIFRSNVSFRYCFLD